MELQFSTRSSFFDPIDRAVRKSGTLDQPLQVELPPGGYERTAEIFIRGEDTNSFSTDWMSKQPSRFSARLRAAATILQRRGFTGRFLLSHVNSVLTIERA
jgi:hypothetical protein